MINVLKKCDYCIEDFEGCSMMFGAFFIRYSPLYNAWFIHCNKAKPQRIYYCPMCGRKLNIK